MAANKHQNLGNLDILKINTRLLHVFGLMNNSKNWKSKLCKIVSRFYLVISVLNVISHAVEACRVINAPMLIIESSGLLLLCMKSTVNLATFIKFEEEFKKLGNMFKENLFNNFDDLTSSEQDIAENGLRWSKNLMKKIWGVNLMMNLSSLLSMLPQNKAFVEEVRRLSAPDWNSPTRYAAPIKVSVSDSLFVRAGYTLVLEMLIFLPYSLVYNFVCTAIMYLTIMFSVLVDSIENSIKNTEQLLEKNKIGEGRRDAGDTLRQNKLNVVAGSVDSLFQVYNFNVKNGDNVVLEDNVDADNTFDEELMKYLKKCVKRHNELMEYFSTVDRLLKPIIITDIFFASLFLGFLGFGLMIIEDKLDATQYISVLLFTLLELGVLCWLADRITTETEMISEAAYKCDWYLQRPRFQRDLGVVIMISQRGMKLTVGPFGNVSMELFGKILNSAYTYIALLRELLK